MSCSPMAPYQIPSIIAPLRQLNPSRVAKRSSSPIVFVSSVNKSFLPKVLLCAVGSPFFTFFRRSYSFLPSIRELTPRTPPNLEELLVEVDVGFEPLATSPEMPLKPV